MPPEKARLGPQSKHNLVRAVYPAVELRESTDSDEAVLSGHFAKFNEWTEINSVWEGRFMERIAPGAFSATFAHDRDRMRPLFQHGQDPQVGDKPLGPIRELREDEEGAYYEVPLLDTSYNRDLIPGLKAGLYGSSFRFSVVRENVEKKPTRSAHNPDGLPERTIEQAHVFEFGPVTFPAYAGATAGIRSLTDAYTIRQFVREPDKFAELLDSMRAETLPGLADDPRSDEGTREAEPGEPVGSPPEAAPPARAVDPPPPVAEPVPSDPAPTAGSSSTRRSPEVNTIEERMSRIDEISERLNDLNTEAGVDVLSDAAQAEWDELVEERETHQKAVDAYEQRKAALEAAAAKPKTTERAEWQKPIVRNAIQFNVAEIRADSRTDAEFVSKLSDNALRAVESASFAHERADEGKNKSHIERLLRNDTSGAFAKHILSTGDPVYQRAFTKLLARQMLTAEEQRAVGTVGSGQNADGGYAVPYTLDPTIILTSNGQVNPLRSMARVETLTTGNTWKGVTSAGISVSRVAEETAVDPTSPTLAQPSVTVQAVKAEIQYSIEADGDWPRLQAEMARLLQDAKDSEEATQFITGNGNGTTGNPEGVVAGLASTSHVGTTGDGLTVDDLFRLQGELPDRFEPNAQFLAHRAVYNAIRQFGTGSSVGEGAVWQNSLQPGQPGQLIGYPARTASAMSSDYTTDDELVLLFGDFQNGYIIVDKVGMSIEIDPHVRNGDGKWTGQRALLAHYRNNAMVLVDNALRALKIGVIVS
jgi:HK97 family phage major capsid protein/HK97 family phage prohead protease